MSLFNGTRLTDDTFKLDIDRMRRGWYSDKYFENIGRLLTAVSKSGLPYAGQHPPPPRPPPPRLARRHQRLRDADRRPGQAGALLPRPVRPARGPGRRRLRLQHRRAAVQPRLRRAPRPL